MEPRIVELDQLLLVGMSFFGDPFSLSAGWTEENEIGRLWSRFMAYAANHTAYIQHLKEPGAMYEVHIENEETMQRGEYEIFVGAEIASLDWVPVDLLVKLLPPATYVVFTLVGEQIVGDWPLLIMDWLEENNYSHAHPFGFQRYDQRFKGVQNIEESVLDVYTPIVQHDA